MSRKEREQKHKSDIRPRWGATKTRPGAKGRGSETGMRAEGGSGARCKIVKSLLAVLKGRVISTL